ncbi:hypothetical protein Tco_1042165 [Tanacetum coccineum]|uniref:Retrotransposon protein, putative, unclassified n=1 Tax=Tanacetum coccineum TaxID=301880 RepID=A0ABQ5GIA3_9ASTR
MVEKNKLDADLQGTPVDATLYRGLIVSLMYLTSSRPDLIYVVCLCARYQAKPTEKHLNAVKQIFRYIKGTINMGLWYSKDTDMSLTAYADANHADYGFQFNKIPLYCANKSEITLCCNNVQHSRAKHIDVRYHFIKEKVENGIVELYFVRTEYQLADIFTKPFLRERFNFLIEKLGMRSMSPETLKHLTEEDDEIINPQETLQVAARDEKWVPSTERVKINSTNLRLETTMSQKEETFQVVIDIIKNSTCFKAFTISADVPKSLCSNSGTPSRRIILNICLRVEGEDFIDVLDDETALTFLLDLGYKGSLNRHTNMFMDHMHQPWRTLAAIINRCLSGKLASNDKILLTRLITGKKRDQGVRICHIPISPKSLINHFLKQHKSLTNLNHKHYHTIKDDGIISRLKFVRIVEDYQEYKHPIPDVMLIDAIKHLESYQMFIKYSKNQIPPKKSRGNGSKGKKTAEEYQETVDLSKESEPEPEPAKKNTANRRVVKKKVTLQTEAEEAEAARKVHATHARIVIESVSESAKKKSSDRNFKSIVIKDTPSTPKSKPATSKTKLKGSPSLTPAEQEAANIMQALKESKKTSRRQPGTEGSHEGTGSKPGVPDESIIVSTTSSEGTGAKPGVPDKDKDITKEKVILEWGDEHDSEHSNDDNDDAEKDEKDGDADDEGDDHDEDEEMKDVKVEGSDKGDEEISNAAKEEAEKTSKAKDDTKKTEVPPSSLSLSVSSGFGDQFLKLSSDSSLVSTVKDFANADVSSLLDIPIQHETPQIQSLSVQKIPVSVIPETTNLPPILEIVTETLVTTADPSP